MRFVVRLRSKTEADIHIDYRRRFISLLKRIFGPQEFERKETRPYTFAVYFGKVKIEEEFIKGVSFINFRFSTGDPIVASLFYNGILKLKKENYSHPIGTGKFEVEKLDLERRTEVTGKFKTLSPVIVERIGYENRKNPEERYVTPGDDTFGESLIENTVRRYQALTGTYTRCSKFSLNPVWYKVEFIKHYGGYLKGFMGEFELDTDSRDMIEFVYKYGLGMRTGQGFGFLSVLK